ncbi:hypothetical protein F5Y19DRAFT_452447 [Xylariaceae sp. FL1651]|nr:hypothetical protein F5Y19DRAFT_452447 [Xylariaceae sp. FL1651]
MESSSRRKACDLCFKKKIRCDGLKPTCSNCSLYKVSCKTTTIRRRPISSHRQIASSEVNAKEAKKDDGIDARLARIEAKLDDLKTSSYGFSLGQLLEQDSPHESVAEIPFSEAPQVSSLANWIGPRGRDEIAVPPLTEVLPIIEVYFNDYNSLIPLFNQQSFMRLLNSYYSSPGERPRAVGAVINVVLAMGYRIQYSHFGDATSGFNDAKIKNCIDNAQMALDELMMRDQDTLGLQALLGLVVMYQTHPDQTASSVLISAAMRLAHSMRLESKTVLAELSPQEARQRSNIFWVCYMLDKDISLRTVTPSSQIDSDIDIDLPGSAPDDNLNIMYSKDGLSQLNLFRCKVQLAHLEGRIYDFLLSNRSRKLSVEARQQTVLQIDRLLERWKQTIPSALQLENMSANLAIGPRVHMTVLYQTYLMCLTMTHGLYAHDSPWLKSLGGLGSDLLRTFNPQSSACMDRKASSSPAVWNKCVNASRAILNILSYQSFGGCNVWLSGCAYFSAMTFVLVNLIYYPSRESAEQDQKLTEHSMVQIQKYFDYKGFDKFSQLRHVLFQLQSVAQSIVKDAKKSPPDANARSKYPFDRAFLPLVLPPGDIFDTSYDPDSAYEEPAPVTGSEWMETSGSSTLGADPAAPTWLEAEPFFEFGST